MTSILVGIAIGYFAELWYTAIVDAPELQWHQ